MGIVEEVGEGVSLLKKGDRVVMPFNVADGRCRNCEEGKTAFCTGVNPGFAGGAYGYVAMGPYRGGYVLSNCMLWPIPDKVMIDRHNTYGSHSPSKSAL
jgi:threonine dehydrogenase-like Zn-dependent dehydrogenase